MIESFLLFTVCTPPSRERRDGSIRPEYLGPTENLLLRFDN
jgi:hypothetical protein